jgi:hypothetical protein
MTSYVKSVKARIEKLKELDTATHIKQLGILALHLAHRCDQAVSDDRQAREIIKELIAP